MMKEKKTIDDDDDGNLGLGLGLLQYGRRQRVVWFSPLLLVVVKKSKTFTTYIRILYAS